MLLQKEKIKNISLVRDDLYPSYYGGNKARKIVFQEKDILDKKKNAVVTTGGIQSNHCRVTALLCAKYGWECHLVIHGSKERFYTENGNAKIIRATGARVSFVQPQEISETMDKAMEDFESEGLKPYYLYGGGHTVHGVMAYAEAVKELKQYCKKTKWKPDHIVLASGTGSTQAGIILGLHLEDIYDIRVTGISIARSKENGTEAISSLLQKVNAEIEINIDYKSNIYFRDDFLCGGYEQTSPELSDFIKELNQETGIVFDTTYSGKAFWGMQKLIGQGEISDNVLFWHTGGIFNYLAK